MGSPESEVGRRNDETQHEVTLTKGFWILETPVRNWLWATIMDDLPNVGDDLPANSLRWQDCADFIEKLNEVGVAPDGWRFDFPTEAEWEYACRAGTTSAYNCGDKITDEDAYFRWSDYKWIPVKKYPPNAWGLYDMHGNVWEWCKDWYGDYPPTSATDPVGPAVGEERVYRGGGRTGLPEDCRSACRTCREPSYLYTVMGFRPILRESTDAERATPSARRSKLAMDLEKARRFVSAKTFLDVEVAISNESRRRLLTPEVGAPLELAINGVSCVFRYCLPGTFAMGSFPGEKGRGDDEPPCIVALTRGFWLLDTPVTQALWNAVALENPSEFQGAALPVENVSWADCAAFISALNAGNPPFDGLKFDFPTEAEWEYACRAGTTTRYSFGDTATSRDANFISSRKKIAETSPVKKYPPNAWGFYDMHGNVWEWCKDWYGDYPPTSATDPVGPQISMERVLRGGGYSECSSGLRAANRGSCEPYSKPNIAGVGFRLVLRGNCEVGDGNSRL